MSEYDSESISSDSSVKSVSSKLSTLSQTTIELLISNILYEIRYILDKIPIEYNFKQVLEEEMINYLNKNSLLRPSSHLIKLAQLKCTRDKVSGTVNKLLTQRKLDNLKSELKSEPGLIKSGTKSASTSAAMGITTFLLEGMDLALFENYLWSKSIPESLSYREKQQYILDNNLKIIGVPERDISRTTKECLNIQNDINKFTTDIYTAKLDELNGLLDIYDPKILENFCDDITNLTDGLPPHLFKEGTKYYKILGFNPNDMNVSRNNPDPKQFSYAYAGKLKHPNDFRRYLGKNIIQNIYTGKPIPSRCFNSLKYREGITLNTKKLNEYGKYESKYIKGGQQSILYNYYMKYQKPHKN